MHSLKVYRTTFTEVCDGELVDPDTFEDSEDCAPDQWDAEEGISAVDKAVEFLANESLTEASSSQFHTGLWYSYIDGSYCSNHYTGEQTEVSAHFDDSWTEEEQREVFERVTARKYV